MHLFAKLIKLGKKTGKKGKSHERATGVAEEVVGKVKGKDVEKTKVIAPEVVADIEYHPLLGVEVRVSCERHADIFGEKVTSYEIWCCIRST